VGIQRHGKQEGVMAYSEPGGATIWDGGYEGVEGGWEGGTMGFRREGVIEALYAYI
jgi:hypothetical protein